MPENERRLILASGEKYREIVSKTQHGGPKHLPYEYAEAKQRVKDQVVSALHSVASLPRKKRFGKEAILCIRLHPDFIAKSYDPDLFFLRTGLDKIGSRKYVVDPQSVARTPAVTKHINNNSTAPMDGRLVFVKGTEQIYERMLRILDNPSSGTFRKEIQKIERFDLLSDEEQKLGFATEWQNGRVEMVFHPSQRSKRDHQEFLFNLIEEFNLSDHRVNIAQYENGPTFISAWLNIPALGAIIGANPLRTIHPFRVRKIEALRGALSRNSPLPAVAKVRSTIKVGMFDGGVNLAHPLLAPYVEQDENLSIKTKADDDYVAHGNAVAGAILYGPLNGKSSSQPIASPDVSVVSIRVLPTSDPLDIDLYESIDVIEKAVPSRQDVKWWNLSVGPEGPILDDEISRFTFATDLLAVKYRVTFCVAVGNDGEASDDMAARIQAPSDLVNGFGVGAYTRKNGNPVHAPYSCKGPGREPGKIKPDLVDFAGCDDHPIHLISIEPGKKILSAGTSFSSPRVASIGAQTTDKFDRGSTLLSRVLLVHSAKHPNSVPDELMGYGIVPEVDEVLYCSTNSVTVVYQDTLGSKQYAKLPIFLPREVANFRKASIRWTVGVLSPIDSKNPTDYTSCCIEDVFYPHADRYTFTPPRGVRKNARVLLRVKDKDEIQGLIQSGWKPSDYPVSGGGDYARPERELRKEMKWETLIRRNIQKMEMSLHKPYLILHANPRNGYEGSVDFAVAITLDLPGFNGDLYARIRQEWQELVPIRLRAENELRIRT